MDLEAFPKLFQSLPRLRETSIHIHLELANGLPGGDWIGSLLAAFPPLKGFDGQHSRERNNMRGLVEGPLSRHFRTLEHLHIRSLKEVTSEDNHLILISCPNLKTFTSKEYQIGRIPLLNQVTLSSYDSNGSEQGPLGWVCSRLTDIFIGYVHETPEKGRLMFEQLCRMKKLEGVDLLRGGACGLDPSLIQWDDEASAMYWNKGTTLHTEKYTENSIEPEQWVHRIWPGMWKFSMYN